MFTINADVDDNLKFKKTIFVSIAKKHIVRIVFIFNSIKHFVECADIFHQSIKLQFIVENAIAVLFVRQNYR